MWMVTALVGAHSRRRQPARIKGPAWCRSESRSIDEESREGGCRDRNDNTERDSARANLTAQRDEATMKMQTYVNFAGQCAEAFRFYEKHLSGTIGMIMTHAQAPDQSQIKPEWKHAVLHARISIGDTELMGADIPHAQPMRSAYLSLSVDRDMEAERIFAALADGGEILMPLEETFFATRFGQLRDRFGINWMILHERAVPSHPAAS